MCLRVNSKVRNNHHKENGYLVGYKVLKDDNLSPFQGFPYKNGVNIDNSLMVSRGNPFKTENIRTGLHLFLNKSDALRERKKFGLQMKMKIVKAFYYSHDVIDYGDFVYQSTNTSVWANNGNCVSVAKLFIKSLDDIQ